MTDKNKALPRPPSWWDMTEDRDIDLAPNESSGIADRLASRTDASYEDRFSIIEPLAKGGMGAIHIARDRNLRRLWRKVERHPIATLSGNLMIVALAATISIIGLYGRYAAEQQRVAPLHYLYAAFEPGPPINYPAIATFPEGYDPRQRPWYRDSQSQL